MFKLLVIKGCVDPCVLPDTYKDYNSLLEKAQEVFNDGENFDPNKDGIFYIFINIDGDVSVNPFLNAELED